MAMQQGHYPTCRSVEYNLGAVLKDEARTTQGRFALYEHGAERLLVQPDGRLVRNWDGDFRQLRQHCNAAAQLPSRSTWGAQRRRFDA